MVRAQLDKNERQVSAMFDQVAEGYDRTRAAIWLGRTTAWGRAAARVATAERGATNDPPAKSGGWPRPPSWAQPLLLP